MEKWKENAIGVGIFILTCAFIFVLVYTIFPVPTRGYPSPCALPSSSSYDSSAKISSYPYGRDDGYFYQGRCLNYTEYDKIMGDLQKKHDTELFASALLLSLIIFAIGIAIRHVQIVGTALAAAGAFSGVISIAMGYSSFNPLVQSLVLGGALIGLVALAYLKLPDHPTVSISDGVSAPVSPPSL